MRPRSGLLVLAEVPEKIAVSLNANGEILVTFSTGEGERAGCAPPMTMLVIMDSLAQAEQLAQDLKNLVARTRAARGIN